MNEVYEFLKKCGTYYIATSDGDQPHVRPFGSLNVFEDKLYIQTGASKAVAQQLLANPKVEVCAMDGGGGGWIRITGKLIADDRREAKQAMLDAHPQLADRYSVDSPETLVLYFQDAVAKVESFGADSATYEF
jgi:uncharacterized pyridoxamine 5'-phosphate oxidase family protein